MAKIAVVTGAASGIGRAVVQRFARDDTGSIVLDEITAMPLCFIVWQGVPSFVLDPWQREDWRVIAVLFVLFRIMDIAKPWPIRHSQKLPGGWGVTVDDALAAIYVAALSAIPLLWNAVVS